MDKPRLLTSEKIAYGVSGKILNLLGKFSCKVSFVGKTNKKKGSICIEKYT